MQCGECGCDEDHRDLRTRERMKIKNRIANYLVIEMGYSQESAIELVEKASESVPAVVGASRSEPQRDASGIPDKSLTCRQEINYYGRCKHDTPKKEGDK